MSDERPDIEREPSVTPSGAATEQPRGTVTFLFTDIQGSTRLWEQFPTAMALALARHDALMREAIAAHDGYVFKTVGDAFCAAFPTESDGLNAAIAAQRALGSEAWGETGPIRVRMALHTGEPEVRDRDYFGQPLNRVARLLSAGHGGQILLSGATERNLRQEELPAGITLRDMGEQRLKDLAGREQVYQAVVPGVPSVFPKLKTPPPPLRGAAASVGTSLVGFVIYVVTTAPPENRGPGLFAPDALLAGFKGLVLELSTIQELFLLGILMMLVLLTGVAFVVWRRASEFRPGAQAGGAVQIAGQFITFRTITFLAASALIVLGAFAYQQYLWRVALPIPPDAVGFAMTQEAAAASYAPELADALFVDGQAQRIIVRELPVRFDARDTERAREMGRRIGARAVVIYRSQRSTAGTEYISYVIFTNPTIGLAVTSAPDTASAVPAGSAQPGVLVKEGIEVPALRTTSLREMIEASAGIIAYHEDRVREAIGHLEAARPTDPDAPNTGIVCFYLGNAYALDNQTARAIEQYDCALGYYERAATSGTRLGPQDRLILAKTYLERGRQEIFSGNRAGALPWFERAIAQREELLARANGLERPGDVRATYARLYAELADVHRYLDDDEAATFWQRRAREEAAAISTSARADDPHAYVQQSSALMFAGDCVGALEALDRALALDPDVADAHSNAAVILYAQGRLDLAEQHLQQVLALRQDDVVARQQLANLAITRAIGSPWFVELAHFSTAAALYEDLLRYDPSNIAAHQALADFASWQGDSHTVDLTALWVGDDINLARSQAEWPADPVRYAAALEAYGEAIQLARVLATELRPGDVDAQLALGAAYFDRQQLAYALILSSAIRGIEIDREAPGALVLTDAEQIHRLAEPLVGTGAPVTDLQRLRAWDLLLKSYDREWGWYRFFAAPEGQPDGAGDALRVEEVTRDYRATLDAALAFIDTFEIQTTDERDAVIQILFARALFGFLVEEQPGAAIAAYTRIAELSEASYADRTADIQHLATICAEARETELATAASDRNDPQQARAHYERALQYNPDYQAALLGLADLDVDSDNPTEAIALATRATQAAPTDPLAWASLGRYHVAAQNRPGASAAYGTFLELVSGRPAQERMGLYRIALKDLDQVHLQRPEAAGTIAALLPHLRSTLAGWEPELGTTLEYPQLCTLLGAFALHAGEPSVAQDVLRWSLELDPRQPAAHAVLALSRIHAGASQEEAIASALAELDHPYWQSINIERSLLISAMEAEVHAYATLYPDQAAVRAFTAALRTARNPSP
jgi:class 3 adenylate cyclase/tetratricopeptide (TPR) repeat protein